MTRRAGSLFTGVLGLDMAATEVFGTELAWACDNDPAAARVIERRAGVPNLGDITAVDWDQVEPVWLLTGGSPCQDVSAAGKRAGMYPGTRSGLWAHMAYTVRCLRPRYVVFENVRGLSSACAENEMGQCPGCVDPRRPHRPFLRALGRVLGDLADLRYDAVWCGLPASAVGAPHERFRIFILAVDTAADAAGDGRNEGRPEPARQQWGPDAALGCGTASADTAGARRPRHIAGAPVARTGAESGGAGEVQPGGLDRTVADSDGVGSVRRWSAWGRRTGPADGDNPAPDTSGAGLEGREPAAGRDMSAGGGVVDWGIYTTAVRRWERVIGRPAPVPRVVGPRGGLKLNSALSEWMQGFPAGWITDVPGVSMNDALKLAGNSVNPYQAVAALRWLAAQLTEGTAA